MNDEPSFLLGTRVTRAMHVRPYDRSPSDPLHRPLRIYTLDPSISRLDGAIVTVNVPYEPLAPGPVGALFAIDDYNETTDELYRVANLDDHRVLISDGYGPSLSEPRFHQQMVYAVCMLVYTAFRHALGRHVAWGYDFVEDNADRARLRVRPHAIEEANAWYDRDRGELAFGYFPAQRSDGRSSLPGGYVFTALSHDIIAHEVTHALLDGLRAHFSYPSGPDVTAFHEAFADLVAIFQHFTYREVVTQAIRRSHGKLEHAEALTNLAAQFGASTTGSTALRTMINLNEELETPKQYNPDGGDPHELGSVLAQGVFDAFLVIFRRKTERYLLLATGGTGLLPDGEIPPSLVQVLAEEASDLAGQFLSICIRAIDYCPPVDIEFGDFLRAVITADRDMVSDDPWAYREAWISAFQKRGIYPEAVENLSEESLAWRPPTVPIAPISALSFSRMKFDGDPACPESTDELRRQARAIGKLVTDPRYMETFGLAAQGEMRPGGDTVSSPQVESIRVARRAGPDGQILFDLIAEVTQRRVVVHGEKRFDFYGGATIILDPKGTIRYVISKSILSTRRLERQRNHVDASPLWELVEGRLQPRHQMFRLLHGGEEDIADIPQ